MTDFATSDSIRATFAAALSGMYRQEVPLYGELVDIVTEVNAKASGTSADPKNPHGADRVARERHGAIRVGTAAELSALRRVFAVMGMEPVGYYDLAPAGVPVHSTAFRPRDDDALAINPFRVFTSLLRFELIEDRALRERAAAILAARQIVSDRAMALVAIHEKAGGLTAAQAGEFIAETLETFRWHGDAVVDRATYDELSHSHRLIADIVSFRGPHINHLTPRTLDIDAAQAAMVRRGIDAKAVIEGPPRRHVPILLRQTSFKALEEDVRFPGAGTEDAGTHTARFGEIEQRGAALTRKGRALYDACLETARADVGVSEHSERLRAAFERFPDDGETMRRDGLAYFRYSAARPGVRLSAREADGDLAGRIDAGDIRVEPILYEDFLPVSAAGIFHSNLGDGTRADGVAAAAQDGFEAALGVPVLDPFALYEAIQQASIDTLRDTPDALSRCA